MGSGLFLEDPWVVFNARRATFAPGKFRKIDLEYQLLTALCCCVPRYSIVVLHFRKTSGNYF